MINNTINDKYTEVNSKVGNKSSNRTKFISGLVFKTFIHL